MPTADDIIAALDLAPHPEGGWYRETWRHQPADGDRGAGTAIYFLLRAGEESRWHRIDADELWHFHGGAPLRLDIAQEGHTESTLLGLDLPAGQRPQRRVPPHAWQRARTLGAWTLVSCTVSPAFDFDRFELAPEGWSPIADDPTPPTP